jgi:hypothetical protein
VVALAALCPEPSRLLSRRWSVAFPISRDAAFMGMVKDLASLAAIEPDLPRQLRDVAFVPTAGGKLASPGANHRTDTKSQHNNFLSFLICVHVRASLWSVLLFGAKNIHAAVAFYCWALSLRGATWACHLHGQAPPHVAHDAVKHSSVSQLFPPSFDWLWVRRSPGELYNPTNAELRELLDGDTAFPSGGWASDAAALAGLEELGMRSRVGPSALMDAARSLGARAGAVDPEDAAAASQLCRRASALFSQLDLNASQAAGLSVCRRSSIHPFASAGPSGCVARPRALSAPCLS